MKNRNYKLDNIKGVLIFLVVFGHLLELFMWNFGEGSKSLVAYKIIYAFHMPFFVFVSGYFARFSLYNIIKKYIYPFVVFQVIYSLMFGNGISLVRPCWILWYLFALTLWMLTLPIIKRCKKTALGISVILALSAGFIEEIGYDFALSRVLCFYPFFIMGNIWGAEKKSLGKGRYIKGILALILGMGLAYILAANISHKELYMSYSYALSGGTVLSRILIMLTAWAIIYAGMMLMPQGKLPVLSAIGRNTLPVFLLHGFLIKLTKFLGHPFVFSESVNIILSLVLALVLTKVLSLPVFAEFIRPFADLGFWKLNKKR